MKLPKKYKKYLPSVATTIVVIAALGLLVSVSDIHFYWAHGTALPVPIEQAPNVQTQQDPQIEVIPHEETFKESVYVNADSFVSLYTKDEYKNASAGSDLFEQLLKYTDAAGHTRLLYDLKPDGLPAQLTGDKEWIFSPLGTYFYFTVIRYEGSDGHLFNLQTGQDIYEAAGIMYGKPLWPKNESFLVVLGPGEPIDGTAPAIYVSTVADPSNLKKIYEEDSYDWENARDLTTIRNVQIQGSTVSFDAGSPTPKHYVYDIEQQKFIQ